MAVRVLHGDMLAVLPTLDADSIHAVVTDPPYHLTTGKRGGTGVASINLNSPAGRSMIGTGFMGMAWDGGDIAMRPETWAEVYRVMKPGAHLVAFGGTRTYHRMACAIEDAGFEIRDTLAWIYGAGFPKSHDVSKAIDKAKRRDYVLVAQSLGLAIPGNNLHDWTKAEHSPGDKWWAEFKAHLSADQWGEIERAVIGSRSVNAGYAFTSEGPTSLPITVPATPESAVWSGWGSALKPAFEPIILARKPLDGTIAANVLRHGVGGINIDACRIETAPGDYSQGGKNQGIGVRATAGTKHERTEQNALGRFPANVLHDGSDEVISAFPDAPGQQGFVGERHGSRETVNCYGDFGPRPDTRPRGDAGSAARFFYCAKADAADRAGSKHPTVKPLALMQWLVKLITPPGGTVLDPFSGSGTTLLAADRLQFDAIGIEQSAEYVADIHRRLQSDAPLFADITP